ncbi:Aste57867_16405 [Aphanomyces stellatus]|uniref:Aste57867_16405 protein n=1 Tax=Aphanomyces stellatus TaxID=120398 RepID=A0A485L5D0_9STRA|nr:hypothetical protein As57867_016348 [Aphanomyces stellatus]VFT93180.1 Aste57867_16405 [Aphanomyces stellatus]
MPSAAIVARLAIVAAAMSTVGFVAAAKAISIDLSGFNLSLGGPVNVSAIGLPIAPSTNPPPAPSFASLTLEVTIANLTTSSPTTVVASSIAPVNNTITRTSSFPTHIALSDPTGPPILLANATSQRPNETDAVVPSVTSPIPSLEPTTTTPVDLPIPHGTTTSNGIQLTVAALASIVVLSSLLHD